MVFTTELAQYVMKTNTNKSRKNYQKKSPAIPSVKDGMYNVAVFWPEALSFLVERTLQAHQGCAKIAPTNHAKDRIRQYGLPVNCYETVLAGTVVEATVVNGFVQKVVTRYSNANGVDWCSAICFENKKVVIITVWCNNSHDQHKTLKADRYVR